MSVVTITIQLPYRAGMWIAQTAKEKRMTGRQYIESVVLKHLSTELGIDLRQYPNTLQGE